RGRGQRCNVAQGEIRAIALCVATSAGNLSHFALLEAVLGDLFPGKYRMVFVLTLLPGLAAAALISLVVQEKDTGSANSGCVFKPGRRALNRKPIDCDPDALQIT